MYCGHLVRGISFIFDEKLRRYTANSHISQSAYSSPQADFNKPV